MEHEHIIHTLEPVFDRRSRVLVLGSMPSPKSRENGFYYGNPQNRFWRALAGALNRETPLSVPEKREFLLSERIALWDVLFECDICGAADSSIKNPVPNDLSLITGGADIRAVFTTGRRAYELYSRFQREKTGLEAIPLPSPSPANARTGMNELINAFGVIKKYL